MSESKNIELPNSWIIAKLSDMVIDPKSDFVDGPFGSNLKADEYRNEGVPVFKIQNIKAGYFLDKNIKFVTPQKADQIKRHSFKFGDIIITKLGEPLGLCCKVPAKYPSGIIVADLMRVRPSDIIVNTDYLVYAINSKIIQDQFKRITKGTTRARVNLTIVRDIEIPIAPLNEQNRIVEKLDELLSELEKGKEQLQTSLEQLKVYRQSILNHAFENTKRLPVGDLYDFVGGGTPSKKNPNYWKGNIPWASVKDIKGDFLTKTQDKISEAGLNDSASNLAKPNEVILITRILPGRPIVTKIETAINQDLKIVKPNFAANPKFIYYSFKSIERECLKKSSGTTVLGINLVKLKEILIPYLDIKEQEILVQEIDRKLSECDKLEETLLQTISQSDITRKSLLQKAFEGKLVEQTLTDEPASALLERIKAEREEYLKIIKERKNVESVQYIKSRIMEIEFKTIIEILKESKEPVSAKTLWQSSTHKDDIDDFYASLKKHIEAGEIIELPRKGKESFLKMADTK